MEDSIKFKNFGELLRTLRKESRIGLREISKEINFDPSNLSKIERGIIPPPKDEEALKNWAKALKIDEKSPLFQQFFDLAEIARGDIPKDILDNEKILPLLPAFFRTIRGKKPTQEQIEQLIEIIRNS